jgi:photoactive yellow protein
MTQSHALAFDDVDALARIVEMDDAQRDGLAFGVIGFDEHHIVRCYNAPESRFSGLAVHQVLGLPFFTEVAQCMNNYLVAQRFQDAGDTGTPLDATIDYVLTWRMRPTRVQLRLLCGPDSPLRLLLLRHLA